MNPTSTDVSRLRDLPSVNKLLDVESVFQLTERFGRASVVRAIRSVIDELRARVLAGDPAPIPGAEEISAGVATALDFEYGRGLRRVVNATGIVAHTGLGRSVLPKDAIDALVEEAKGYCLLQFDRATTGRTKRDQFCVDLIREITGAESALVVNNNCAATMLVLNSLADGKEVIISRGQLVEIGGAFRIPDVLRRSGGTLVEVGCTNKTHLRDYEAAITENTGLLMKVHTSNYRMIGFVKEVPVGEMAELAHSRGLPVMDDLGAGAFFDLRPYGYPEEPLVQDSVKAGADVISISADKLIGGPQGGIILGKKKYIDLIRKNPLARMVRVGKLTLIALEATLKYFLDRQRAFREHPTTRMLTVSLEDLESQAREIAKGIGDIDGAAVEVREDASEVGSGAYPAHQIPTCVVSVRHSEIPASELSLRMRMRPYAVFARVKEDALLIDPRTVQPDELGEVAAAVREALEAGHGG